MKHRNGPCPATLQRAKVDYVFEFSFEKHAEVLCFPHAKHENRRQAHKGLESKDKNLAEIGQDV